MNSRRATVRIFNRFVCKRSTLCFGFAGPGLCACLCGVYIACISEYTSSMYCGCKYFRLKSKCVRVYRLADRSPLLLCGLHEFSIANASVCIRTFDGAMATAENTTFYT